MFILFIIKSGAVCIYLLIKKEFDQLGRAVHQGSICFLVTILSKPDQLPYNI